MPTPIERSYGWQVRWRHAEIVGGLWQNVSFRRDEGQTIVNANQLCDFLDVVGRRIADTDEWITSGRYRFESPAAFVKKLPKGGNLRGLILAYERANAGRTPRRITQMRQRQERYFRDWLDLAPSRITTDMVNDRHAQLMLPVAQGGFGLKESSALAMMQAILPVLRYGVEVGRFKKTINPRELSFKRSPAKRDSFVEPLTEKEFYALLVQADDFVPLPGMVLRRRKDVLSPAQLLRLVLEIMGETGMRIGEVLALAAEDIDLAQGIIHVDYHMVVAERVPGTKNGHRRKVFLTDALAARLKPIVESRKPAEPIFRAARGGGFLTYNSWREMWDRFVIQVHAAGILRSKITLTPHLFRHSFACWMALKVPAIVLMEIMGHADIKTTQRYYTRGGGAVEVARTARQEIANAHGHGRHLRAVS